MVLGFHTSLVRSPPREVDFLILPVCLSVLPKTTSLWGLREKERKAETAPAKEAGARLGQVLLVRCQHLSHIHSGDVPILCTDGCRLGNHYLGIETLSFQD